MGTTYLGHSCMVSVKCPACNGSGRDDVTDSNSRGFTSLSWPCHKCEGRRVIEVPLAPPHEPCNPAPPADGGEMKSLASNDPKQQAQPRPVVS